MQWTKKLVGNEDERAVSPVIGVILMVAITVILAAVIAAFVLDLGPSETDPVAAVSIDGDGTSEATVTLQSMDNADGIAILEDGGDGDVVDEITVVGGSESYTTGDLAGDEGLVIVYSGEVPTSGTTTLSDLDDEPGITIAVVDDFTVS